MRLDRKHHLHRIRRTLATAFWLAGFVLAGAPVTDGVLAGAAAAAPPGPGAGDEMERAGRIIGPDGSDNSCVNCHAREIDAWKLTRHYTTFVDRHRSDRAKEIQTNLGRTGIAAAMKKSPDCRQCHYTSILMNGEITPRWGVSCESCHSPGREWNNIHNKAGGDPQGRTLKWGEGRQESAEARAARIGAAASKGMLHAAMIYDIATNCFGCHTVPNETLVNKGRHKAGSDFDFVAWSQGEVRHNFLSSPGAPGKPANRPASPEEKRRLFVVGTLVDLEVTLRNLSGVKEPGGEFHRAMIERANRVRRKADAILKAVPMADVSAVLRELPATVDATTSIAAGLPDRLGRAAKTMAAGRADLAAIDAQIPAEVKGKALE